MAEGLVKSCQIHWAAYT